METETCRSQGNSIISRLFRWFAYFLGRRTLTHFRFSLVIFYWGKRDTLLHMTVVGKIHVFTTERKFSQKTWFLVHFLAISISIEGHNKSNFQVYFLDLKNWANTLTSSVGDHGLHNTGKMHETECKLTKVFFGQP